MRSVSTKKRGVSALARRKARHWHPEVMSAIREAVLTGASAAGVLDSLEQLQMDGGLQDRTGEPLPLPSVRTIQDIARPWKRDDSGRWQLTDSSPADVRGVLDVLAAVIERSRGRVQSLTKTEAQLIPLMLQATGTQLRPWDAFLLVRFYMYWRGRESGDQDLVPWLAFAGDQERMRRNVANGWLRRRDLSTELIGWLPNELPREEIEDLLNEMRRLREPPLRRDG